MTVFDILYSVAFSFTGVCLVYIAGRELCYFVKGESYLDLDDVMVSLAVFILGVISLVVGIVWWFAWL